MSLRVCAQFIEHMHVLIKKRQGRMVDALGQNRDEGRGKLRNASMSC
jgi:hypothetical protein